MWEDNEGERRWPSGLQDFKVLEGVHTGICTRPSSLGGLPGEEGALEGLSAHLLNACEEGLPGGQWGAVVLGAGSAGPGRTLPIAHLHRLLVRTRAGRPQPRKPQWLLLSLCDHDHDRDWLSAAPMATPHPLQRRPPGLCACCPLGQLFPPLSLTCELLLVLQDRLKCPLR